MIQSNAHTIIHPEAQIGQGVVVGPFTYIDKDVVIGDGTWIGPNVTIFEGARIGKDCKVFPGAVIAGIPQDLKFEGEYSNVFIGDRTIIREYVTVNRGTKFNDSFKTVVGNHCLLMAYVHVAHDCILGDEVILANNVNLAGHVEIEDWAILEGLVAVQQFIRIGKHSFVAGGSLVRKNVPPYIKAAREPLSYAGINAVGLNRRHFTSETINHIHEIYRILFVKGFNLSRAIQEVEDNIESTPEREDILSFIREAEAGVVRGYQSLNGSGVYED